MSCGRLTNMFVECPARLCTSPPGPGEDFLAVTCCASPLFLPAYFAIPFFFVLLIRDVKLTLLLVSVVQTLVLFTRAVFYDFDGVLVGDLLLNVFLSAGLGCLTAISFIDVFRIPRISRPGSQRLWEALGVVALFGIQAAVPYWNADDFRIGLSLSYLVYILTVLLFTLRQEDKSYAVILVWILTASTVYIPHLWGRNLTTATRAEWSFGVPNEVILHLLLTCSVAMLGSLMLVLVSFFSEDRKRLLRLKGVGMFIVVAALSLGVVAALDRSTGWNIAFAICGSLAVVVAFAYATFVPTFVFNDSFNAQSDGDIKWPFG